MGGDGESRRRPQSLHLPQLRQQLQPLRASIPRLPLAHCPLCPRCLALIHSTAACSYFFSNFSSSDGHLRCLDCSHNIHIYYAPLYRDHITVSDLNPDSFTCIDCRPILKPGNQPSNMSSPVSIEDLARHTRAAAEMKATTASCAREKAKQKAVMADQAESRAKRLLGTITRGTCTQPARRNAAMTEE